MSLFGRHNWKQRWFILEHGILSYYDSYDVRSCKPGSLKGTVDIKQATVLEVVHSDKPNVFQIVPLEDEPILLHSEGDDDKQAC